MLLNSRSGFAEVSSAQERSVFQGAIKRNCSMSPRAVLILLAATAAVCFTIGALFAWQGLWLSLIHI